MKNKKLILFFLAMFPMIMDIPIIIHLPEYVKSCSGEWIPKLKLLLTPTLSLAVMVLFFSFIQYMNRKSSSSDREAAKLSSHIHYYTNITLCLLCAINVMNILHLVAAGRNEFDFYQAMCILTGSMLMMIGNLQPKLQDYKDPVKSKWNSAKPSTWMKSNRVTGLIFVVCGILIIAEALIVGGAESMIIMFFLILASSVTAAVMSDKIYRSNEK